MSNDNGYQRFGQDQTVENEKYCPTVNSREQQSEPEPMVMTMIKATEQRQLAHRKVLLGLAMAELAQSLLLILFESVLILVMSIRGDYRHCPMCGIGNGVWAGVFGLIAASLGLAATRSSTGQRCALVAHLVLNIIAAVLDAVVVILTSICILVTSEFCYRHFPREMLGRGSVRWMRFANESIDIITGIEGFILVVALTHFICVIVSSAFLCRSLCRTEPSRVVLTYTPVTLVPKDVALAAESGQYYGLHVKMPTNLQHNMVTQ